MLGADLKKAKGELKEIEKMANKKEEVNKSIAAACMELEAFYRDFCKKNMIPHVLSVEVSAKEVKFKELDTTKRIPPKNTKPDARMKNPIWRAMYF
jgi:hypothetical protein